jgi:NAD(P)-dependent dehydrogenase (short-subunit alcohol dehydrogenase family)
MSNEYLNSLFSLAGKVAVVIGGTGELCGNMALSLAKAGAEVVLADINEERAAPKLALIAQAGGKGYFQFADVTKKASLETLLANVIEKSGKVDILINGAGINSSTPFFDIEEAEIDRILAINLKGIYLACQVIGKHMIDRGEGGSIINLGSMSGLIPLSRVFTYSVSKAGVHNLTKNLAREWAPYKVRVNAMVPGFFPAEQNRAVLTPDRVAKIMGHTPMNRYGDPQELMGATILLASDAASFMTGNLMVVDGGFSSMTI